jgi:glutamate synthase domain-containing protein 1
MLFLPQDIHARERCLDIVEETVFRENLGFLGWREVPVDSSAISGLALKNQPAIFQCFIDGKGLRQESLDRKLYIVRRQLEASVDRTLGKNHPFYISSLSSRTIVYKGLFTAPQLRAFYKDLTDENLVSALAVVHQRYSTNTFPSWELAQPFRYLCHNGEINILRGNLNLIRSRESSLE